MKQDIHRLNQMQRFEHINGITAKQGLKAAGIARARPYLLRLSERLQINEHEALMLSACVNLGCVFFLKDGNEHIMRRDLEGFSTIPTRLRRHVRMLESVEHLLQKAGLIEFSCAAGQVESNAWKLTERAKRELLHRSSATRIGFY